MPLTMAAKKHTHSQNPILIIGTVGVQITFLTFIWQWLASL